MLKDEKGQSQLSQRPASDEAKPNPSAATPVAAEEHHHELSANDNSPRGDNSNIYIYIYVYIYIHIYMYIYIYIYMLLIKVVWNMNSISHMLGIITPIRWKLCKKREVLVQYVERKYGKMM